MQGLRLLRGLCAAAAVLVAGCSSSVSRSTEGSSSRPVAAAASATIADAAGSDGTTTSTTAVAPASAPPEATTQTTPEPFPLDAVLGIALDRAPNLEKQARVEELTAECMTAEGWDYIPRPVAGDAAPPEFSSQYGEQFGYGVIHNYEEALRAGEAADPGDPNAVYVDSLTESEKQQYFVSLDGNQTDGYDPHSGCANIAATDVFGLSALQTNPDIGSRVQDFFSTLDSDPRMVPAMDLNKACLSEQLPELAGLEPYAFVQQQFNEAHDSATAASGAPDSGQTLHSLPVDELERLRSLELDVWRAERDCRVSSGLDDARRQVEQEFVDALLIEFPELVDRSKANG